MVPGPAGASSGKQGVRETSVNLRSPRREAALRSGGEVDLQDFVAQRAARHLDLGDVADLLAEQALAARAGGEDFVVVVILLAGADQFVHLLLAGIDVLDADAGAKDDGAGRQLTAV